MVRLAQIAANRFPSADVVQLMGRVKVNVMISAHTMYDIDILLIA